MSAIQRIPPGLLRLLGIQSGGRNPGELGGAYAPTIEMRDWLYSRSVEGLSSTSGTLTATSGFQTFAPVLLVPDSEFWFVVYDSAVFVPANACAGAVYLQALAPNPAGGPATTSYGSPSQLFGVGARTTMVGPMTGRFAPPGTTWTGSWSLDVNPNATFSANVRFVRLPL